MGGSLSRYHMDLSGEDILHNKWFFAKSSHTNDGRFRNKWNGFFERKHVRLDNFNFFFFLSWCSIIYYSTERTSVIYQKLIISIVTCSLCVWTDVVFPIYIYTKTFNDRLCLFDVPSSSHPKIIPILPPAWTFELTTHCVFSKNMYINTELKSRFYLQKFVFKFSLACQADANIKLFMKRI